MATDAATATTTGARPGLRDLLREDWHAHGGAWHRPGLHAVWVHRLAQRRGELPRALRAPAGVVVGLLYFVVRNLYGIEIPRTARIGRRLVIGHQGGIVVGEEVEIGDDCLIRQNATIGIVARGTPSPRIGDRVEIGAGAVVLGGITVGDEAVIGPNAVVVVDVPAGARAVAPPARVTRAAPAVETDGGSAAHADDVTLAHLLGVLHAALELDGFVDGDTSLIGSGLVDSLNLVVLVAALEQAYGIELDGDDLDAERLDTPRQMLELVRRRRAE